MKRTSRELKALARNALKGHYATLIGATVLLGIFTCILGLLPQTLIRSSSKPSSLILQFIVTLIVGVLGYLLQLGITAMILRMIRGQYFGVGDLLYAFQHHPDRFIILGIIEMLISTVLQLPADICLYNASYSAHPASRAMLGSLLMLAASIISLIILLGFALCEMLMIDNEDLGAIDSIRQSFALMSGNKGRLFYIQLSFFGLALLAILSCGIGLLWLMPYMLTTEVFFYMDVCGELDQPHYDDPYMGSGNYGGNEWNTYNTNGSSYNNGSGNNYGNGYTNGSDNSYGSSYNNSSNNSYGSGFNGSDNSYSAGSDRDSYNYGQSNDHDNYNTEA